MPERFFVPLCIAREPSPIMIGQLPDAFNISLTASAICFARLSEEQVVVILSQEGHIRWFRGSQQYEALRQKVRLLIDPRNRLHRPGLSTPKRPMSTQQRASRNNANLKCPGLLELNPLHGHVSRTASKGIGTRSRACATTNRWLQNSGRFSRLSAAVWFWSVRMYFAPFTVTM